MYKRNAETPAEYGEQFFSWEVFEIFSGDGGFVGEIVEFEIRYSHLLLLEEQPEAQRLFKDEFNAKNRKKHFFCIEEIGNSFALMREEIKDLDFVDGQIDLLAFFLQIR